jgi:thiol-disulfide isomerase/thioredoxin
MNTKILPALAAALLCAGAALEAQPSNAVPTADDQLQQLARNVQAKAAAGKRSEADFADEFKTLDNLIAANRGAKSDNAVHTAYLKGMLYLEVIKDYAKATEAMSYVLTNYPDTDFGRSAMGIIEKIASSDPDLKTEQTSAAVLTGIAAHYPDTQYGQYAAALLEKVSKISAARKIRDGLVVGTVFPDFTATNLEGAPLSVGALKGKVVLLDFWATWCPVCVAELPEVTETYKKHHVEGFEIIGLNLDSERGKLDQFLKENPGVTWPQYFNAQDLALKYGAYQIPLTLLIGPNGKIIAKDLRGPEVEMAVAEALALK